jgi:hypothetical protein
MHKYHPPYILSGILDYIKISKLVLVEMDDRITLQDRVKCVLPLRTMA